VLILWELDYCENGGVTRNQLHDMTYQLYFTKRGSRSKTEIVKRTETHNTHSVDKTNEHANVTTTTIISMREKRRKNIHM